MNKKLGKYAGFRLDGEGAAQFAQLLVGENSRRRDSAFGGEAFVKDSVDIIFRDPVVIAHFTA
ncbi:Uncharacterised protein [Klebsiella variicola]|nr:Uncharacterised protein [Klebsiella variicola]